MIAQRNYDCVIIGSGPAGGTVACLVAEQGHSTLLIEREKMPRFHVGESLMPETFGVFDRLGIVHELQRIGFTRKNGVQFVTSDDKETRPFIFSEYDDSEAAVTWHIQRAEFDKLLYDSAYNRGANVVDELRVMDIDIKKKSPHTISVRQADGKEFDISAKVVVDASGQQTLIANRLGLKEGYDDLRKAAIWGYFEGAKRNGGSNPEVTCILHTSTKDAWFWYIPLSDGTVSVGLVGDNDFILKRGSSPEKTFMEEVKNCPGVGRRLTDAKQNGKYFVAKEFSYRTTKQAGDGWVLVGDAGGFIDPIYSSGVFLACVSGAWAADAICEGLSKNDLSAKQLGRWTNKYESGVDMIRKLVRAFYSKPFSFGDFIKKFPQHRQNLTNLLVGKVFEGNPGEIFKDMDPWIEELESGKKMAKT
jgi:flavin-dependent dehydrogenase